MTPVDFDHRELVVDIMYSLKMGYFTSVYFSYP